MGLVYPFLETDEVTYMKRAAEKLRSSRGASLMMALLLFLTCAVVGSAVLTAGTAASGRMSKIAESDQRYYSVNSAANLLIDLFKDETVKITETVKKDASTGEVTTTYKINDSDYPPSSISSFPVETACRIIERNMAGSSANISLTVTLPAPCPTVGIAETIFTDDRVEFVVTSDPTKTEKYELHLVFKADKTENHTVKVTDTETTTTTETSITWKLSGVK